MSSLLLVKYLLKINLIIVKNNHPFVKITFLMLKLRLKTKNMQTAVLPWK